MLPVGYMAKRVKPPTGFPIPGIADVYSVSGCVNQDFADYINFWKHNGYWFFDSPEIIKSVSREHSISLDGTLLFYYEVYEKEFDGKIWREFKPSSSFETNVICPDTRTLEGFDVVSFQRCSPLSCNYVAEEIPTNKHCLLKSFEEAYQNLSDGKFNNSEPGPYRIFAVYGVEWP